MISSSGIDLLLTPVSVAGFVLFFVVSLVLLIGVRNRLSPQVKLLLICILVICLIYFAFLLWLIFLFGSNSPQRVPQPVPAASRLEGPGSSVLTKSWPS